MSDIASRPSLAEVLPAIAAYVKTPEGARALREAAAEIAENLPEDEAIPALTYEQLHTPMDI